MKTIYIMYKLVTCTKQGDDETANYQNYFKWGDNELSNWIKLCSKLPIESSFLEFLKHDHSKVGNSEKQKYFENLNAKSTENNQKYCNLICENQMTSNGLTKIEHDNMQRFIGLIEEISYSTMDFEESEDFKKDHIYNNIIVKENKILDTFQARVDENLADSDTMELEDANV